MLWFSSRLYRVGILMYGKRATLPEILRWLRYSEQSESESKDLCHGLRIKIERVTAEDKPRFTLAQRLVLAVVPRVVWALFCDRRPHLAL